MAQHQKVLHKFTLVFFFFPFPRCAVHSGICFITSCILDLRRFIVSISPISHSQEDIPTLLEEAVGASQNLMPSPLVLSSHKNGEANENGTVILPEKICAEMVAASNSTKPDESSSKSSETKPASTVTSSSNHGEFQGNG